MLYKLNSYQLSSNNTMSQSINRVNCNGNGNGNDNGNGNGNERRELKCYFDPKWVNLIIGQCGETAKSIARGAGSGCSVWHHNDRRGHFTISSWNSNANGRAKLAIEALIKKEQDKEKNKKKGFMNIDPKMCGFVIGKRGETVKGLAQKAGTGCSITFDMNAKGRIIIIAPDNDTIVRAKMEITNLLRVKDGKDKQEYKGEEEVKSKAVKVKNDANGSGFAALQSESESETEEEKEEEKPTENSKRDAKRLNNFKKKSAKQDRDLTHLLGFNGGNSGIKALKEQGWEERKVYKQWLETVGTEWDELAVDKKNTYGGNNKRGWDNYLYEKKGERFRAQEQANRVGATVQIEEAIKEAHSAPSDHSEWERLGDGPVSQPKDIWGRGEGLEEVRKEGTFSRKTTQEKEEDSATTPTPPTPPTTELLTLRRSPVTGLSTPSQPLKDSWSDDEDDEYDQECNCGSSFSLTKTQRLIPGVMNQGMSDMHGYDDDISDWGNHDISEYA